VIDYGANKGVVGLTGTINDEAPYQQPLKAPKRIHEASAASIDTFDVSETHSHPLY
jgi:hypothetical protein